MHRFPRTAVLLIVSALPFALLIGLGWKTVRDDRELEEARFTALLDATLESAAGALERVVIARENHLADTLGQVAPTAEALRDRLQEEPYVRQFFLLDNKGRLLFPRNDGTASQDERAFLDRTTPLFSGGERFVRSLDRPDKRSDRGFYVRYVDEGAMLIFWQVREDGTLIGAELSRSALLSDLIGAFPEKLPPGVDVADAQMLLRDESGRPLFGFGQLDSGATDVPRATRALSEPLGALTLELHLADRALPTHASYRFSRWIFIAIGALFLLLILGTLFYLRETGRELREASERVTFVNQVSHELKTPLTNIRMYAELLEMNLEALDADETTVRRLDVIVQESNRLSRLIDNVLAFGRRVRGKLTLNYAPIVIDDIIEETARRFRPALALKAIALHFDGNATRPVLADSDATAQIVGNLLSNVEKYAAEGKNVRISSRQTETETVILVADCGPGIPKAVATQVFEPFFRVSSSVTDGVAGTGIGLAIARDLARLHGGDLTLLPSESGACFQVVLNTDPTQHPSSPEDSET